jgi:purine-binding chemotaxis protein CheW
MHPSAVTRETVNNTRDEQDLWLVCRAGSTLYALSLGHVVEIMRVLPIEPIAGAPAYVSGLSIVRGAPTPIIDAALLCGGGMAPARRLVIVRTGPRVVALAVEKVLGIRSIESGEPLPPLLREAASDVVSGIGRLDSDLLVFLSTARVVPDEWLDRLGDRETAV